MTASNPIFECVLTDILYGTEDNHFPPKDDLPTTFNFIWEGPEDYDYLTYRQKGEQLDTAYYNAMKALSKSVNHEVYDCEWIVNRK